jgi:hypothetical protein
MARGVKQKKSGLNVDSSIWDAVKSAKDRRKQLDAAAGTEHNKVDDLSEALDTEGMTDMEKDIFEN